MSTDKKINTLKLPSKLITKLQDNNFNIIEEIWVSNRKKLKNLGFIDSEIKSIIIALQLEGLDLNKKKYD